ncbi:putative G-protein coupled receptor 139 [Mytilus galloprovincialis]|uniref:putative G-protein coupled receptor 139 n=1 Tax=Mytilus galloprovincialis TaxID=29158 RepID=UPI003F7B7370
MNTVYPSPNSSHLIIAENIKLLRDPGITMSSRNMTKGPSLAEILETFDSYNTAMYLIKWVMPLIIFTGTVGNIFSFIVMLRREMRQTPTFFYLAMLAIADTLVLFVSAFKTWLRTVSGFELSHINAFSCKLTMFLVHFSIQFSAWLIVAVTIERFLAVWFPLKANSMCNLSRARFITFMTAMIFILVNIHIFWTAQLFPTKQSLDGSNFVCAAYAYENFVCRIFPWINLILYSFLPCLTLLIFNILIIICLMKTKHIPNTMTKDDCQIRNTHRKLAITLIFISFAWIITTTPRPLYGLFAPKPKSYEDMADTLMWRVICYQLMYINHAVNFFLYCLSGEKFRIQFKKFLCQLCRRRKPPKARLTFKSSGSNSTGQDGYSSIPLVSVPVIEISMFDLEN